MHLDADDLLKQIQTDYPIEFEIARLRLLVARQEEEIQRLTARAAPLPQQAPYRAFGNPEETRVDLSIP
ncbi:hypothetical protein [Actinoplanes rectilineatus]|uniref:hypothetical protein n=1 Tax=Actinoplanes rectilineatus TaxID=113571 RepID=UPI0005F2E3BF|nr:hypothetical protein [Actinoplanes rectilineatus]